MFRKNKKSKESTVDNPFEAAVVESTMFRHMPKLFIKPALSTEPIATVKGPPDSETGSSDYKGIVAGRSVSSYPHVPGDPERYGDPIADRFHCKVYGDRAIICIADGCNWGKKVVEAADRASRAFVDYLSDVITTIKDTKSTREALLGAVEAAHMSIFDGKVQEDGHWWGLGQTTLLGGMILPVDPAQSDMFCPGYEFVCVSVGDCVAAGTRVATAAGLSHSIEHIALGTHVVAFDEEKATVATEGPTVSVAVAKGMKQVLALTLADGRTLSVTPDHRMLVAGSTTAHRYVQARNLVVDTDALVVALADALVVDDPTADAASSSASFVVPGTDGALTLGTRRLAVLAWARLAGRAAAGVPAAATDVAVVTDACEAALASAAAGPSLADAAPPVRREWLAAYLGARLSAGDVEVDGDRLSLAAARLSPDARRALASLVPDWAGGDSLAVLPFASVVGVRHAPAVLARLSLATIRASASLPGESWSAFASRVALDEAAGTVCLPLVAVTAQPTPVPVFDLTVPGYESFTANGAVAHNCKAFIYNGRIEDITAANRQNASDARDSGGRLGPAFDFETDDVRELADLRNLSLFSMPCDDGDVLILVTDGVHDNLDPQHLGKLPKDMPKSMNLEPVSDWSRVDQAKAEQAKNVFRIAFLEKHVEGATDSLDLCNRLVEHCLKTTSASRRFMMENAGRKVPEDYRSFPGKMDHTSCVCLRVGDFGAAAGKEEVEES
jgi:hypothetical protein